MTRCFGFLIATVLLATTALAAPPPAPAPDGSPVLRGDARLEKPLTTAATNQPMKEFLAAVAREIETPLTAAPSTQDDKVSLSVAGRPAAEVLARLAGHFDFTWTRRGGGYELTQTAASRARERALWEKELNDRLAAISARMQRLARLSMSSRDQLEARRQEIDRKLGAGNLEPGQQAELQEERQAIGDLLRQGGFAAIAIFRALSPLQLQQLRGGGEIRLSTASGSLPAAAGDAIHQAAGEPAGERQVFAFSAGGAGARPPAAQAADALPPLQADVTVRLSDEGGMGFRTGPPAQRQYRLQFEFTSVRGDGMQRRAQPFIWSPQIAASGAGTGPVVPTATDDPALLQRVQLDLPRAPATPAPALPALPALDGNWPAGLTLGQVARELHRLSGLPVLVDSFVRARLAGTTVAAISGRPLPVVQILDTLAHDLGYTWEKRDGWVTLRDSTFYRDRPEEVPERVLAPWRQRVSRAGAANLDELAVLALALNDPQCRGMQDYWGWYLEPTGIPAPSGPSGFYGNRQHLRFWGSLFAPQRQSAIAGAIVPVEKMNPVQRLAFAAALAAKTEMRFMQPDLDRPPTAAEIAAGGFSLRASEMHQQAFTGTGPDGEQRRGIILQGVESQGPGAAPPLPQAPARLALPGGAQLDLQPVGGVTLLDNYTFNYHLAGQQAPAKTARINVPRAPRKQP